ncbi:hypothetical protein GCM10023194_74790 [Planotetraspora phitsanulokensis]|uniref:Uncharacterized protein n=1 Tax=Planotetraspora phitsanulokensis TaxID=575192 RepID=A0A8J3U4G4_9ACTN|nr:hypothetical protein Pph01_20240 [Planotetraspora phitsanulokensis]
MEWHDQVADSKCVKVQTFYENRSNTAIKMIAQTFLTDYTPKHRAGQYPDSKNGPIKTLTQNVGIPPFETREVTWDVCAPELAKLMNPPSADGTDGYMSEVGAAPQGFKWRWFSR